METSQAVGGETPPLPSPAPAAAPSEGVLQQLAFFIGGLVLPLGSLTFYRKASRQRVAIAILFFFLFTGSISVLATLNVAKGLWPVQGEIQKAFDQGKIPEITIQDGIAQVQGAQTKVFYDEPDLFLAIDTTGQYTRIDRSKYKQGFLLTRDRLYFLNQNGQYQNVPLSELNRGFNMNPIVINAQTTIQYWLICAIIVVIVVFLALIFWYIFVRLMYVATLALIAWAVISLFRPKAGFGPVIVSGLYALVPAIYLSFLFDQAELSFPGLQTLLWIPFWVIGLVACFSEADFFQEKSARVWRALIGLPLLLLLVADIFVTYPYEAGIAWAVMVLTMFALIGVGLLTRRPNAPPVAMTPLP